MSTSRYRSRFRPPRLEPRTPAPRPRGPSRRRVQVQLVPEPPPLAPAAAGRNRTLLLLLGLLTLVGCAREDVVHAGDEAQANAVLVALESRGMTAERRADDAHEGGWIVSVPSRDAVAARRALAEEQLPRSRAPGFGEVFGEPGLVPTPLEERARYLHALAGELARSVEAIDGVAEARVHLALAPEDPLRTQAPPPPRAAVLVKVRPGLRTRVEPMKDGIRSLVSGAVAGLDAGTVSVVLSESSPAVSATPSRPGRRARPLLLGCSALAALGAAGLFAWPLRGRAAELLRRR